MSAHKIRVLCESKDTSFAVTDSTTGEPLFWWRGNDLSIDLALSDNGVFLTAADIGTITVVMKALDAGADDAPAMIKVLGSVDCDSEFTAADWLGGSGQLCVASWTRVEAALNAGSYVIVVSHDDGNGKRNTYLHSRIEVREDQHDSVSLSAPPVPASEYYTKPETDALLAASANPFDQDLNTDDPVEFAEVVAGEYKYTADHFVSEATTSRTLTNADHGKTILCSNAAATTVTVPASLEANFWCSVVQLGAGAVTLDDDTGATTLNTAGDLVTSAQYASLSVANYGTADTYLVQ